VPSGSIKGERLLPKVVVFDVNETLLNLAALDPHFERAFGAASARPQWFAQVLQSALVATVIGDYVDFGTIGAAALDMTAARRGISLAASDRAAILDGMLTLPPHPEVPESLERLRAAGFRLATLTNSTAKVAEAQLTNAGLIEAFDQVLSVDAVRQFKPAAVTYGMAARELGVAMSDLLLVAAHDWDIAGALSAGWAAAFVARTGMVLGSLSEPPAIVGKDLREIVDQILGE
jgi:2-haloacid dehalogenase